MTTEDTLEAQRAQLAAERAAFAREKSTHRAEAQVRAMAERMGFRSPERAWIAVSKDLDRLDIDPEGSGARNVVAPLEQLAAEEPYLLVPPRGTA